MKKPSKTSIRSKTAPRGTVVPSPARAINRADPGTVGTGMASRAPGRTDEAGGDISNVVSLRTRDCLDVAVGDGRRPMPGDRDFGACPMPPGRPDASLRHVPDGIECRHLKPDKDDYRPRHLRLLVDAVGKIVGSSYGSTWVKARTEACALYRRSQIRCVSVTEPKVEHDAS